MIDIISTNINGIGFLMKRKTQIVSKWKNAGWRHGPSGREPTSMMS
jgi:hypothetical protein